MNSNINERVHLAASSCPKTSHHSGRIYILISGLETSIRRKLAFDTGAWVCVSIERRKMATEALRLLP